MQNKLLTSLLIVLIMVACTKPSERIEIQGHRGARGLAPENSIPGFKKALDLGVQTLEVDVVVSKDKKVVISHEPYISSAICNDVDGKEINPEKERDYNMYEMDYEQIQKFDCGSKLNSRFPDQEKHTAQKPLLSEMIKEIENYVEKNNLDKPNYNIEIKSVPEDDGKYHPYPPEFSDLVYEVIKNEIPKERVNIQSFDKRILQYWRKNYPDYELAYLVEEAISPQEMENILGFKAEIYSPYFETLSEELVNEYHQANIKVIPWTINEVEDMRRIKEMKVDGIITDYPDRAIGL